MNILKLITSSFLTILPICAILGIAGNAIPIARASIADLKIHDFRTAMGWATTIIGFGYFVAVLLAMILAPIGVISITLLIHLCVR